jgi:hypothetical protein
MVRARTARWAGAPVRSRRLLPTSPGAASAQEVGPDHLFRTALDGIRDWILERCLTSGGDGDAPPGQSQLTSGLKGENVPDGFSECAQTCRLQWATPASSRGGTPPTSKG